MLRLAVVFTACLTLISASALAATPAFSVHKNGTDQTVTQDIATKLSWSTEAFDTNTNFASDRFTPTVAGKYLIVLSAQCVQAGQCVPSIYKNGALLARSQATNVNIGQTPQVTAIVDMNGSTDYIEAFVTSAGSAVGGAADRTYFNGVQLDGGSGSATLAALTDVSTTGIGDGKALVYNSTSSKWEPVTITPNGTQVAFSANKNNTNQTVTTSSMVKLTWSTEVFDTNNNFDPGTSRFTPTVAGKYLIGLSAYCLGATSWCQVMILKNGVAVSDRGTSSGPSVPDTNVIVDMNGSTDYIEAYVWNGGGTTISGNISQTSFYGSLLGSGGGASQWSDGSAGAIYHEGGNVGIGLSSPSYRLDVLPASAVNQTIARFGAGGSSDGLTVKQDASSNLIYSFTSGNVGIGTTAPAFKLDVVGAIRGGVAGAGDVLIIGNDSKLIDINIANTAGFYGAQDSTVGSLMLGSGGPTISGANGNVGIGTTSPSYTLDVAGTARATTIIAAPPMMILADEKANGTAGGTCTAGSWFTRTLNTVWENSITGASLSSDQFTLPAGKYLIRGRSPGVATNRLQARLYNVTDAAVSRYGSNGYGSQTAPNTQTESVIAAIVTIAASKAFRIEHQCNTTKATNGLGLEGSFGGVEIYTTVEITKLQ